MQLLLIAFSAWLISQLVKFSLKALHDKPDFRLFYQSGGMPSAHSATVVALAVSALALEGLSSPVFGLATVLAAIVIYDTLGVRRSSGEQSVILNSVMAKLGDLKPIREVLGHTPKEVLAGMILGAVVGLTFTFPSWSQEAAWLTSEPGATERLVYLAGFSVLVAVGVVVRVVLSRYRQVATIKRLISALWWSVMLPGFTGLFISLLQYQTVGAPSWRLWALIVWAGFLVAQLFLAGSLYKGVRSSYSDESDRLLKSRREQRKARQRQKKKSSKRKRR